jgi:hypothetical protein
MQRRLAIQRLRDVQRKSKRYRATRRFVMLLVPDITAGTGTEFQETLVRGGSGGLSQSEGAQERVLSVDGSLPGL